MNLRMNLKHLACLILLWLAPGAARSATEPFRSDINPALLYWQAFALWPSLPDADHDYVFNTDWRGRPMEERFGELVRRYDSSFKLLHRAVQARVPCEWGYDLTFGPEAELPGLAKAKAAAQVARLRVPWHLHQGDQAAARDDLVASYVLGRQVSQDGILISALVQHAIESIVTAAIAENFYKFSPETLRQILNGIDASPPRGTIAQCIPMERVSFRDWLVRKMESIQANAATETQAQAQIRAVVEALIASGPWPDSKRIDEIMQASGGTVPGMIAYIKQVDALYDEADAIMTLPYAKFQEKIKGFMQAIEDHPNRFVHVFFPVFENVRYKEFAAEVTLAMLRAGIEYRLGGEPALKRFQDPLFQEPFAFRRVTMDGTDLGFELKSRMTARAFDEVVIFIEKPGPSIQVIGKNAGRRIASVSTP